MCLTNSVQLTMIAWLCVSRTQFNSHDDSVTMCLTNSQVNDSRSMYLSNSQDDSMPMCLSNSQDDSMSMRWFSVDRMRVDAIIFCSHLAKSLQKKMLLACWHAMRWFSVDAIIFCSHIAKSLQKKIACWHAMRWFSVYRMRVDAIIFCSHLAKSLQKKIACWPMWETTFPRSSHAGLGRHFTNETYSRVWNMFVKSLPNPAWLLLGNVVSHMDIADMRCDVSVELRQTHKMMMIACRCVCRTHKMSMCLTNSQVHDSIPM